MKIISSNILIIIVQLLSHVCLFATPWTAARQAPLSSPISQNCSNSCPLSQWCYLNISSSAIPFSSCLQSFPSIRVFFQWVKLFASGGQSIGASFSFNISPSSEHSGLILFWIYWFDLLAVLGTLKSLLQHHISKASILWYSAFLMVQLSHLYMTIGKP